MIPIEKKPKKNDVEVYLDIIIGICIIASGIYAGAKYDPGMLWLILAGGKNMIAAVNRIEDSSKNNEIPPDGP